MISSQLAVLGCVSGAVLAWGFQEMDKSLTGLTEMLCIGLPLFAAFLSKDCVTLKDRYIDYHDISMAKKRTIKR